MIDNLKLKLFIGLNVASVTRIERKTNSDNPPVIELVLSLQFEPIAFSTGDFVSLWQSHFSKYAFFEDAFPIEDQFENFTESMISSQALKIMRLKNHAPRFVLSNESGDRLIQFQSTRFFCNWRFKPGSSYPRYSEFRDWFLNLFLIWANALGERNRRVILNQFELTYVDAFYQGDMWNNLSDWKNISPQLFSALENLGHGLTVSNRSARWSFDLPDQFGRLHVNSTYGRPNLESSSADALLLNSTVRGPIDNKCDLRDSFDKAHEIVVAFFKSAVSDEVLMRCP